MLTEIEWWGGLLIVWLLGIMKLSSSTIEQTCWPDWCLYIAIIAAIGCISLSFYDLHNPVFFWGQLSLLSIGVITFPASFYSPDTAESNATSDKTEEDMSNAVSVIQFLLNIPIVAGFLIAGFQLYPLFPYAFV